MKTTWTKEIGRWSEEMTARMIEAYGAADFERLINARVVALMCAYAGRRCDAPKGTTIDMVKVDLVSDVLGFTRSAIINRIHTIVQNAVHGSRKSSTRNARLIVIKEYARRGIRTAEEIRQADKSAASPQPEQLSPPPSATRTLDVIAAELRKAKHDHDCAEVAACVARSRVEALRAELRAAVEEV